MPDPHPSPPAQPLSAAEIAAIQARWDRISRGPWTSYVEGLDHYGGDSFIMTGDADLYPLHLSHEEQDFAARARQDVGRLLAEISNITQGKRALLSEGQLAEMEMRCASIRPGPWSATTRRQTQHGPESVVTAGDGSRFELLGGTEDDHAFIAHVRLDIPRLIAEARRLHQTAPRAP